MNILAKFEQERGCLVHFLRLLAVCWPATLPCNLSLIAYLLTLMSHKVVWQHLQGVDL